MSELNIPDTWAEATFGDIGSSCIGLTYSPKDKSENGVPVLRSGNIQNEKIDLDDLVRVEKEIKPQIVLQEGDILICARNGSRRLVGKAALIESLPEKMTFGAFMTILRSPYSRYVVRFINSHLFRQQLDGVGTATINQITQSNLKSFKIPFPPQKEQERIVQKIESCFEKIDETKQNLNQVEILLSKYRESLLAKAFRGELIEQDTNDEPASALLAKIREEREANQKGKKKKVEFAPVSDDEKPFDIPESWEWVSLGELLSVSSGKMLSAKNQKGGEVPVYGGNGITGYHDASNVEKSVIIIGRVGAKCGVVHITEPKSWVTDNALIVKFNDKVLEMNFLAALLAFLNLNQLSNSSAQPVISGEKIYKVLIPLPPINEQERIVNGLQRHTNLVKEVESNIHNKKSLCRVLRESVLSKAFQGVLVEQVPSEGTGHQLLEKIIQNREKLKPVKKSKKKTKKK